MIINIIFLFTSVLSAQVSVEDSIIERSTDFENKIKSINQCDKEVCIQLVNHDKIKKSFDIFILNAVPVAGFQCDFQGIAIEGSDEGLLKENAYQTSNNESRILSFSMQGQLIPIGEGVLTKIYYSNPAEEVCMVEIIFAGIGGKQLSNNQPECIKLK